MPACGGSTEPIFIFKLMGWRLALQRANLQDYKCCGDWLTNEPVPFLPVTWRLALQRASFHLKLPMLSKMLMGPRERRKKDMQKKTTFFCFHFLFQALFSNKF